MSELTRLIEQQESCVAAIGAYKKHLIEINDQIENLVSVPLSEVRKLQRKDTGTVACVVDDVLVKQDLPKKVMWDQAELVKLHKRITDGDDDPGKYIDVKFSVSEKKYKTFVPAVQTLFMVARTVDVGKPKLTFKLEK